MFNCSFCGFGVHSKSMKKYSRALIIFTLGLLTILGLLKVGNIEISLDTLQRINPFFLTIAVLVHYSGFVVRGWRWQKVLDGMGHRVSYRYATTLLVSGWFASALLPARLGDVLRASLLKRDHGVPLAHGFGSVATERALDIFAILLLAAVAAVWALAGRTPAWVWQTLGGGIALVVALVVTLIAAPQLEDFFARLLPWRLYRRAVHFGFELLASIRQLGEKPGLLSVVAGQSIYIWLCDVFLMYFVILSLGIVVPVSIAAFTGMTVDLAAAVPIVPGALGQVEGTALGVLSLFQIHPEQSSLIILLNRFISYWTFIIVSGAVAYFFGFSQALKNNELQIVNREQ